MPSLDAAALPRTVHSTLQGVVLAVVTVRDLATACCKPHVAVHFAIRAEKVVIVFSSALLMGFFRYFMARIARGVALASVQLRIALPSVGTVVVVKARPTLAVWCVEPWLRPFTITMGPERSNVRVVAAAPTRTIFSNGDPSFC